MEYSKIAVKSIELPFGKRRFEYEWQGDSNIAQINGGMSWQVIDNLKVGQEFWLGHLQLIPTDYNPYADTYEVALADGQGYQRFYNRRLHYFLDNLKCRIILTLYVWGLAHLEPHERITWASVGRKKK